MSVEDIEDFFVQVDVSPEPNSISYKPDTVTHFHPPSRSTFPYKIELGWMGEEATRLEEWFDTSYTDPIELPVSLWGETDTLEFYASEWSLEGYTLNRLKAVSKGVLWQEHDALDEDDVSTFEIS